MSVGLKGLRDILNNNASSVGYAEITKIKKYVVLGTLDENHRED
jgi:hypothetical protein